MSVKNPLDISEGSKEPLPLVVFTVNLFTLNLLSNKLDIVAISFLTLLLASTLLVFASSNILSVNKSISLFIITLSLYKAYIASDAESYDFPYPASFALKILSIDLLFSSKNLSGVMLTLSAGIWPSTSSCLYFKISSCLISEKGLSFKDLEATSFAIAICKSFISCVFVSKLAGLLFSKSVIRSIIVLLSVFLKFLVNSK